MRKVAGSACIVLLGLGQSISGWQSPVFGFALMGAGLILGLLAVISDERVRQRFPYAIVRRSDLGLTAVPGEADQARGRLDSSLDEIEAYLGEVNRRMERHGFGRNPGSARTATPLSQATPLSLKRALQDQLRRGRRIRASASITTEGSSGPIEVWEQEVALLLEDAGRHDLLTRFDARTAGDVLRGVLSGPWATRARIDRKLQAISEFIRELPD